MEHPRLRFAAFWLLKKNFESTKSNNQITINKEGERCLHIPRALLIVADTGNEEVIVICDLSENVRLLIWSIPPQDYALILSLLGARSVEVLKTWRGPSWRKWVHRGKCSGVCYYWLLLVFSLSPGPQQYEPSQPVMPYLQRQTEVSETVGHSKSFFLYVACVR